MLPPHKSVLPLTSPKRCIVHSCSHHKVIATSLTVPVVQPATDGFDFLIADLSLFCFNFNESNNKLLEMCPSHQQKND